jgi:hypothetical protein
MIRSRRKRKRYYKIKPYYYRGFMVFSYNGVDVLRASKKTQREIEANYLKSLEESRDWRNPTRSEIFNLCPDKQNISQSLLYTF